jgi:hypothetical protein
MNPGGRVDIANSILEVPLKHEDNELLTGIASPLEDWGMVARVEDIDGISLQNGTDVKLVNLIICYSNRVRRLFYWFNGLQIF